MSTIECGICFLQYDEKKLTPRILTSCGHTVCHQCALQFLRDERTITCPFDRTVTQINGNEGVKGLPKNFALLELSRKANQEQEKNSGKKADVPCFENSFHEAVVYCQQCEVDLCEKCFTSVHKPKALSAHRKVNISVKPIDLPKRLEHPHNTAKLFCTDGTEKKLKMKNDLQNTDEIKCLENSHRSRLYVNGVQITSFRFTPLN
ncbi:unnamed protein product [Caenorhabditis brenneri]